MVQFNTLCVLNEFWAYFLTEISIIFKLFLRFVEDPGEEYQKMNKIRQDLGTVQVKILSQNRPKMDEIGEKYGK